MSKDANYVDPLLAVSNSDGKTILAVKADPSKHALKVNNGSTGSDKGPADAPHDNNDVPTLVATSSADGATPVVVYTDSNGMLLIQST